jgi:hypothetical protein
MKLFNLILGLLLIPLGVAITRVFMEVIRSLPGPSGASPLFWWFCGGFCLWVVLFAALPRPTLTYVLAHELTHALWGVLMGARVSRLKVGSKGGSVMVSRNNVWITLAPYFFPFYTFLVVIAFVLLSLKWEMVWTYPFWAGLIGLTWSYHLTFTAMALNLQQPDIKIHGRLFSYVLIYLINLAFAAAAMTFLGENSFADLGQSILAYAKSTYVEAWSYVRDGFDRAWSYLP